MISAWPDSLVDALGGPFGGALVVVAMACWLVFRRLDLASRRNAALLGALDVLVAALAAVLLAREVTLPWDPVVEAELDHPGQEVRVPPVDSRLSVFLRGDLATPERGHSATVRYRVAVWEGDHAVVRREGRFEARWHRGRVGRGVRLPVLEASDEARLDLPEDLRRHALVLRMEELDGDARGPIHARLVPGPPAKGLVLAVFAALYAVAFAADAAHRFRTPFGPGVAFLGAFAWWMLDGITPDAPLQAVLAPALMAVITGWLGAVLVRRLGAGFASARPARSG